LIIAIDTCVLIDFQSGIINAPVLLLKEKLLPRTVRIPPVVFTEFSSDPRIDKKHYEFLHGIKILEIFDGYWHRAGETRKILLKKGLKAKLGDALIAQSCIDNDIPLLTRDDDFRHYAKYCDLKLIKNN
jgi:predicted nucleic acid-binding protein